MKQDHREELKHIAHSTKQELNKLQMYGKEYLNSFPEEVRNGLVFSETDGKKLTEAYYLFISSLSASLSNIDAAFSHMPSVMIEADRCFDTDGMSICNGLLCTYGEFRESVNSFANKNERDILSKSLSPSNMLRYFSELNYKANIFIKYLSELDI